MNIVFYLYLLLCCLCGFAGFGALALMSLVLFVWKIFRNWHKVEQFREERLWPYGWAFIAALPGAGVYFASRLRKRTEGMLALPMSPLWEDNDNGLELEKADWILFLENHDHKNNQHLGTRMIALYEPHYNLSTVNDGAPSTIPVEVPRALRDKQSCFLEPQGAGGWSLWNGATHPIPIIKQSGAVESCSPLGEVNLDSGDQFLLWLSHFHILRIPRLGIFIGTSKKPSLELQDGTGFTFVSASNSAFVEVRLSAYKGHLYFRQYEFRNSASCKVNYQSIIDGRDYRELDRNETLLLQPGDRFVVTSVQNGQQTEYCVDYVAFQEA